MTPKSPLSAKVAFRLIAGRPRAADLAADLAMEYRHRPPALVMAPRLPEGVRAVIVDKDNAPRWRPASLARRPTAMVDAVFAPLPPDQEWTPLPEAVG